LVYGGNDGTNGNKYLKGLRRARTILVCPEVSSSELRKIGISEQLHIFPKAQVTANKIVRYLKSTDMWSSFFMLISNPFWEGYNN